jgi:hypothetical protein
MVSTGTLQVVSELLPELIEQFPGAWEIEDSHHCTVAASDNIQDARRKPWCSCTRHLSDGRCIIYYFDPFAFTFA